MSIFKVLIICTKKVNLGHGDWSFVDDQRAYSNYQYFSTLEKAKAFCQQYLPDPIVWESTLGDCWDFESDIANFNIYLEDGAEFDTLTKPSLPNIFATRSNYGD